MQRMIIGSVCAHEMQRASVMVERHLMESMELVDNPEVVVQLCGGAASSPAPDHFKGFEQASFRLVILPSAACFHAGSFARIWRRGASRSGSTQPME